MKKRTLYIHYETKLVGTLTEDENDLLYFLYDSNWVRGSESFPLSLALPLRDQEYSGKVVTAFFENLIPEGEQRRQIERFADLPAGDDTAFLQRFGEDCAGALSITNQVHHQTNLRQNLEKHIPFSEIEDAIKKGVSMASLIQQNAELPQFSLAGAQAKFPCCVRDQIIYLPSAGSPTTHIIKLPIWSGESLLDSVENEYVSMRLAKMCGLNVPEVFILGENIKLFCIERFDRLVEHHHVHRIHTQDFCQALGRPSKEKYETHGGPSFADCYKLVQDHSNEVASDLFSLLDWIGFNLAIGNNDSHAKNLSLILSGNGIRLAPFYDLISTALYPQYNARFSFRIAEVTSWNKINAARVDIFAKKLSLRGQFVISRWLSIFEKMNASFSELTRDITPDKATIKVINKIRGEVEKRTKTLSKALKSA